MKTRIITFFVLLLVVLPIQAFVLSNTLKVEDKKDIELKGDTEDDNTKSLHLPYGAYQMDNQEVCVMPYGAYSNVSVRILDTNGWVMDDYTSGLSPLQTISFDISNYPAGTYTLVITTPQGTYLTGVFEVD
jgi:hypothetical protein